ncbi:Methylene-tetrahydrofolate reductase C terminal [Haloechinothrix alba]|uniref:Methylene-tetrahydrofolate reductase C terminal n=1 Tax=Haloechinothrix alba TaxID=664784 RepID=A0A238Y4Q2_9PSEU|nr:methylenetetrahydrofolate reductase C-terminal domain-containing protein [Haloechinothrix alba]SNR66175.1 Methylene-tetrahydrofolate reductase C terminal [Haloechinothrix alba]
MPPPRAVPTRPALSSRTLYRLHRLLEPNGLYRFVARVVERHAWLRRPFTRTEESVKRKVFGCRMCGQCALPVTGYACPMTCPKQLRNGPCGGVLPDGGCEVYPGERCVWLIAVERAEAGGHAGDLERLHRPIDQRQWGESSWINYWQGRDDGLWTEPGGRATPVDLGLPVLVTGKGDRER